MIVIIFYFWLKSCSESAFKWEAFYILLVLKTKIECACTDLGKQLGALPCKIKPCIIKLYYILPVYPMQWELKKTYIWILAFLFFPPESMGQKCGSTTVLSVWSAWISNLWQAASNTVSLCLVTCCYCAWLKSICSRAMLCPWIPTDIQIKWSVMSLIADKYESSCAGRFQILKISNTCNC